MRFVHGTVLGRDVVIVALVTVGAAVVGSVVALLLVLVGAELPALVVGSVNRWEGWVGVEGGGGG